MLNHSTNTVKVYQNEYGHNYCINALQKYKNKYKYNVFKDYLTIYKMNMNIITVWMPFKRIVVNKHIYIKDVPTVNKL